MDYDSICFSNRGEAWKNQFGSKEGNLQVKDLERILLKKDEQITLLERSILDKNTSISCFEKQNHELLQKLHAFELTSEITNRGETEEQVVNDLLMLGMSDKPNFRISTLPESKWDGEILASENKVSGLHQELEWLRSEKSVKTVSNNLNGISFISYLAEEVNNGDRVDVQRNTLAVPEENTTINGTTKVFDSHLTGEPHLSNNISEETADIILESPLKRMSKEQLIAHYRRVVGAMRRDKESLLTDKTEEIYKLKGKILGEKCKDREIHVLRKTLDETTRKLDDVMKQHKKLQDQLQAENRRMLELLAGKERELKSLCDSKELEYSSRESYLLNKIAELENEREEIEVKKRNEIGILRKYLEEIIKEKTVSSNMALQECVELRKQKHSLEEMVQDKDRVLSLVLMEKEDQKQQIKMMENLIESKENGHKELQGLLQQSLKERQELKRQNVYIETLILEKEKDLDSAKRVQNELIKEIVLLEEAIEESSHFVDVTLRDLKLARKERIILEETVQDRENALDKIMQEEKGKRTELEGIITEKDYALNSAQREIEKRLKETLVLKESFEKKNVALECTMKRIKQEVQEKQFFEGNVQKLEDCIKSMQVELQMEQKQSQMELSRYIRNTVDAYLKLEDLALEKLHHNFLRLGGAERQLITLRGLANPFALKESHYKKMYEKKHSNLQKAEEEVDLLGDEVDSLLSLLGKIYSVLNHYAPILQHYPGILDLVKLIKKEIMGHVDMEIKL